MPNDLLLRNISQSCHRPMAGAANSRPNTMATPKRSRRRRWPKNSWKRCTSGCVLAENAVGANRSAMMRLRMASSTNVPPNMRNSVILAPSTPQNTSVRCTERFHRYST